MSATLHLDDELGTRPEVQVHESEKKHEHRVSPASWTSNGSLAPSETTEPDIEPSKDHPDPEALRPASTNTAPWSVFSVREKRFIVFMVAVAGFFSPLSANIYFPALNTLAADFGTSQSIMNLTLTTYMIFQGLAPTVFGDFADMAGRRPAYIIGFVIYIAACIGIACCNSFAALLILRMVQSSGSSSTIALASGVVADIATSAERGTFMGWATSGPMVASAIAPVLGGIFAQFLGWRWIFWFLVIISGAYVTLFVVTFPETGRNVVGNGSIPPQGWNMNLLNYLKLRRERLSIQQLQRTYSRQSGRSAQEELRSRRSLRVPNPLKTMRVLLEKDVALLLCYNALGFSAFYVVTSSAPSLWADIYGFSALEVGLCFLPLGVGCLIAPAVSGKVLDWNFRRTARKIGYEIVKGKANELRNFPIERCRIQVTLPSIALAAVAMICYGWVLQIETNLAAPMVLTFIMGFGLQAAFNTMNVLVVDLYPLSPATATAAANLTRCLLGAGATAVILYMIDAMGRGWCFTFIALVLLACSPMLFIVQRCGPAWREVRRQRIEATKSGT